MAGIIMAKINKQMKLYNRKPKSIRTNHNEKN